MQFGDKQQAFRFGTLVDAIITEPDRVNYYQLTVDDVQYTEDEFHHAKQMHHAERSGLLHHTTTMLRAANAIMSVYPQLNASLLIAGVIVHDLAKIDEMDADTLGLVSDYSVDGKLIGHIVRGVVNIQLAAEKTKASPGKALLLQPPHFLVM